MDVLSDFAARCARQGTTEGSDTAWRRCAFTSCEVDAMGRIAIDHSWQRVDTLERIGSGLGNWGVLGSGLHENRGLLQLTLDSEGYPLNMARSLNSDARGKLKGKDAMQITKSFHLIGAAVIFGTLLAGGG